jgi:MFS family permease
MESFDMFLNGNFVALGAFQRQYGVLIDAANDIYAIPTRWQSALFQAGQCGAFVGVLMAGPITDRLGYRWTTILALVLMNATIFISFFVSSTTHLNVDRIRLTPFTEGRLPCRSDRGASIGRCPVGIIYCELTRLRKRGRAPRPSGCLHGDSANELVDRWNYSRSCHLWI